MATGATGTFVIRWTQTWIDDLPATAETVPHVGASWRWSGQALRMDGPDEILRLGGGEGVADIHARAAAKARHLCRLVARPIPANEISIDEDQLLDRCFVLTDGRRAYAASRIETGRSTAPLLAFLGELPPAETELWVARVATTPRAEARARAVPLRGATGFAAGARIATLSGLRPVEDLQPGDMLQTRDDGPQPLQWLASRRVSGARLHMTPALRPIRVRRGALGENGAGADLLVAPEQRLLVTGPVAQRLFAEREVLVRAEDLLVVPGISRALDINDVTYVQLMMERHQVLSVAGTACESLHVDTTGPDLLGVVPSVGELPDMTFAGPPARRRLDAGEAAILASRLA